MDNPEQVFIESKQTPEGFCLLFLWFQLKVTVLLSSPLLFSSLLSFGQEKRWKISLQCTGLSLFVPFYGVLDIGEKLDAQRFTQVNLENHDFGELIGRCAVEKVSEALQVGLLTFDCEMVQGLNALLDAVRRARVLQPALAAEQKHIA